MKKLLLFAVLVIVCVSVSFGQTQKVIDDLNNFYYFRTAMTNAMGYGGIGTRTFTNLFFYDTVRVSGLTSAGIVGLQILMPSANANFDSTIVLSSFVKVDTLIVGRNDTTGVGVRTMGYAWKVWKW